MVRLIYILGVPRSGSTILGCLLGSHPRIDSLGELNKLVTLDGVVPCSCGRLARECTFWSNVIERWSARLGSPDPVREHLPLQQRFERTRQMPRVLLERRRASRAFTRYAQGVTTLIESIGEASGMPLLVDSSKPPARLLAMAATERIDLRVLHLVRDPRGVAWSEGRLVPRPKLGREPRSPRAPWRSALVWSLLNALSETVKARMPATDTLTIRYEDVITSPAETLGRIGELLDVDLSVLSERVRSKTPLMVGHLIGGNRLRFSNSVVVRGDFEWDERLPARARRTVELLTGRLTRRYGYASGPAPAGRPA